MPACIDRRKAHLHRQHGDLLAVYIWICVEYCFVLIPAFRQKALWCVGMKSADLCDYEQREPTDAALPEEPGQTPLVFNEVATKVDRH